MTSAGRASMLRVRRLTTIALIHIGARQQTMVSWGRFWIGMSTGGGSWRAQAADLIAAAQSSRSRAEHVNAHTCACPTSNGDPMNGRIAVITPYCRESTDVLAQCHDSVMGQGVQADHFLVADGHPNKAVDGWNAQHIVLPRAHGDNGNTPRAVGSIVAETEGYEFIAYLDADNWFHPDHLRSLLALQEATHAPVVCAWRTFHRLDGAVLDISEADENVFNHVDTSCYLIHRSAFACISCWHRMSKALSPICDRIFFRALKNGRYGMAFTRRRTVAFRSQYENHYRAVGQEPPANAKSDSDFESCKEYLTSVSGINEIVEKLGFWPWS